MSDFYLNYHLATHSPTRILSASVRENILFSHEYEETFYNLVIEGELSLLHILGCIPIFLHSMRPGSRSCIIISRRPDGGGRKRFVYCCNLASLSDAAGAGITVGLCFVVSYKVGTNFCVAQRGAACADLSCSRRLCTSRPVCHVNPQLDTFC